MTESIAVVGAGGRMGRWFAKYFLERGFAVTAYDEEAEVTQEGVTLANSLVGAILRVDYVLLCTPTRRTPEIIRLIAKEMRRGAYLIEISSQKSKTSSALSKVPAKIKPVCVHPMFGPGASSIIGQNIISVPVRDGKGELEISKKLFEGASFVTISASEHDKKIAMILGLTHLINLAFCSVISKDDKSSLTERMSGSTFRIQKVLAEGVMTQSPELIETIVTNPEIHRFADEFWKDVGRLLSAIQDGKTEEIARYIDACRGRLSDDDIAESYRKQMKMMSVIDA